MKEVGDKLRLLSLLTGPIGLGLNANLHGKVSMLDLESFKSVKYFSWSFRPAVVVRDDESIRGFVIPSDAPPGGWVKASPPVIEWEGRPMSKADFHEAFADRLTAS